MSTAREQAIETIQLCASEDVLTARTLPRHLKSEPAATAFASTRLEAWKHAVSDGEPVRAAAELLGRAYACAVYVKHARVALTARRVTLL